MAAAAAATAPTYHVLGAGAMGCLFAASIARHGNEGLGAALLTRPRPRQLQEQQQQQRGIIRVTETYKGRGSEAAGFEVGVSVEENGGGSRPPVARVLVLTKAYDALPALRALAPRLAPDAVVVLLSNGMGHYEEVRAEPRLAHITRWLLGTTTHGALLFPSHSPVSTPAPAYHVSHTGRGETHLGLPPLPSVKDPSESLAALHTVLSELAPASDALGLHAHAQEADTPQSSATAMGRRLWMKLVANACINPLTALTRRRNGAVAARDGSLGPVVTALCTEAANVAARATAAGGVMPSSTSPPDAAELEAYVRQVAQQTARNESSMLRDVMHGRQTEIDYVNGHIVLEARRLNVAVPTHETMVRLVQAMEAEEGEEESVRGEEEKEERG